MRELVEYLNKSLVSDPDAVQVEEVEAGRVLVYEVIVAEEDVELVGQQPAIAAVFVEQHGDVVTLPQPIECLLRGAVLLDPLRRVTHAGDDVRGHVGRA